MNTQATHTWKSVLGQLEFDLAELRHEHANLNLYQPEAVQEASRLLHRARVAFSLDVTLSAWATAEKRRYLQNRRALEPSGINIHHMHL